MMKAEINTARAAKPLIFAACFFASLSSVFIKASDAPSSVLVFYRVVISSLLMLPYILLRCREQISIAARRTDAGRSARRALAISVVSGVFLAVHFYFYFKSLTLTGIAASVVLVNTEVFFVAAAMLVFFSERIPALGWCGIILAFIGSVIIAVSDSGITSSPIGKLTGELTGDILALAGAAAMAVYTMLGRVCRRTLSTAIYTFTVYVSASLSMLLILLFTDTPIFGYSPKNFLTAALLAVFCTLLGHSIFSWGLKYEAPAFISMAKLTEPFFASALGFVIFTEIPDPLVAAGGVIVIAGICVYIKAPSRTRHDAAVCDIKASVKTDKK